MEIIEAKKRFFTRQLMNWHLVANFRILPWKEEKDPYKVWLSEVILQQTRAQQGLPYYIKFIEAYPSVQSMASAYDEDVFRLWQGLGYYNRCKNMLNTARYIAEQLKGTFPDKYDELLKLKGIGPYTAAAISSFAFGLPHAVVDGNVYRVLARFFGIDTPFDSKEGKKQFQALAQELLHANDSAGYNQAIMDLGATVCTPALPVCNHCPLQAQCLAYHQQLTAYLPVRSKKIQVRKRYFHYILLISDEQLWIHKRTGKDIWENLYQPYLIEADSALDANVISLYIDNGVINTSGKLSFEGTLSQKLTHQIIETRFFSLKASEKIKTSLEGGMWIAFNELKKFAFPKTLVSFLEKKLYF